MSSHWKNLALLLMTAAAIGLGVVVWQRGQRIAELERSAARSLEENRKLWQQVADAKQRIATAETSPAAKETEGRSARERTKTSGSPGGAAITTKAVASPFENPNMTRMMSAGMKATLDQRYGSLFRQFKLSPAELDKFKDLLTERQISVIDALGAGRAQGLGAAEIPALVSKVQADVDDSIRQLLGGDRYERYTDFNRNIGSYTLLDQIDRRLSYTNAPLQPSQSDALLRVLIETAPAASANAADPQKAEKVVMQNFAGVAPMIAGITQPMLNNETVARASTVLSPTQAEVLRQLQAEQQAQAATFQNVRAGAAAAGGPGMITPGGTVDFMVVPNKPPTPKP